MTSDWLRGYSAAAAVCLAVLVIAPAGAVYWFMNEAAGAQAGAARRGQMEAYRNQLGLAGDRIEATWRDRINALSGNDIALAPDGRADRVDADGIVLFGKPGQPTVYPRLGQTTADATTASQAIDDAAGTRANALEFDLGQLPAAAELWGRIAESAGDDPAKAALAARNRIRCLVRLKRKDPALSEIRRWFYSGPTAVQADATGRLIAADELLLALQLMPANHPERTVVTRRLTSLLSKRDAMPAPQRLFVMDAARQVDVAIPFFQGYERERLAVLYAESNPQPPPVSAELQRTTVPGVWQIVSKDRTAVALYRAETIAALGEASISQAIRDRNSRFELRPGTPTGELSIALGPVMPGWRLSLSIDQNPLQTAGRETRSRYLFFGTLVLATMAITALAGGRLLSRQLRLARLKTDLTAAVSHELRTPLASTRLLLENLLAESSPNPGTTREYLELLSGENERLRRVVDNFLTFSRIDRNKQSFRFEPLDPAEVAKAAVLALHSESKTAIALDISPDLPPIRGDEDALLTVLLNLLDNANKFSPAQKDIRMRVFLSDGKCVAFAISDNGIGIPSREQRKIFRKFYQIDRRLARERGGCGLGLSIVQYLVEAHGGTVSVNSAPECGSTFEVRIPQWAVV